MRFGGRQAPPRLRGAACHLSPALFFPAQDMGDGNMCAFYLIDSNLSCRGIIMGI